MSLLKRLERLEAIEAITNNRPGLLILVNFGRKDKTLGFMHGGLKLYRKPGETLDECQARATDLWQDPHGMVIVQGFGEDNELN